MEKITPCVAKQALGDLEVGSVLEQVIGPYLEAIINNELPSYFLSRIQKYQLYSNYCEPGTVLGAWHPEYPFIKCRYSVIRSIANLLGSMVTQEVVTDQEIIDIIHDFRHFNWNAQKGAKYEFWTSPTEITIIDQTLELVALHLQNTCGLTPQPQKSIRKILEVEREEYRRRSGV